MSATLQGAAALPAFERRFWDGVFRFTQMGAGELGGKAAALVRMRDVLATHAGLAGFAPFTIDVPVMAVIATRCYDEFLARNRLSLERFSEDSDDAIARAFQRADLPVELLGDLRALVEQVKSPLAVRSSSRLEDALDRPFAGVYVTKMLPNNEPDADTRFRRLTEAVKLVYASAFLEKARDYIRAAGRDAREEKMAVILQEVVGRRHGERFYPDVAGVARSYNFYPNEPARPEDGVASLALGLGKTVVDGGACWSFSPAYPKRPPPFRSLREMLRLTQREFWAIGMGKPPAYDPVSEAESLVACELDAAAYDGTLALAASTVDEVSGIVLPGWRPGGTPLLDFGPLLAEGRLPLAPLLRALLAACEQAFAAQVEIEFALTCEELRGEPPRARFGFLQVRPMSADAEVVEVAADELRDPRALIASSRVIGNGVIEGIRDVVYVRPDRFQPAASWQAAKEIERLNRRLMQEGRPYLLAGLGRWGSSQPLLGVPVAWSQIAGARCIVEATSPAMDSDLSQASHFFHNLASFHALYFMVRHDEGPAIRWERLAALPAESEGEYVRHVRAPRPLVIRADGRTGRGVVLAPEEAR